MCKKPNFNTEKEINIVVNQDDNVNSLIKKILLKKWGFAISKDESEDPESWEESIDNYLNSLNTFLKNKGIEEPTIKEVLSSVRTLLLTNAPNVEELEDNEPEIPDAELDTSKQKIKIKLSTQLRNIFGDDRILTNNFRKLFKSEIFRRTIIQIGKGIEDSRIIYDVSTLNRAIMQYESYLYDTLCEYLKKYDLISDEDIDDLYDENGNKNLEDFSKYLNVFLLFLNSQENLLKRLATETYSGNTELLNAIHSFLTLEYFNELMLESVGKYLYINTKQTQPIIEDDGKIKYKYSINRKNVNLASGWQNEIRDGIDEIGSFSLLVIELIPLIGTNSTLDKVSTITAFLKLKYAISRLGDASKLPNRIRIRQAYKNLNKNTIGAWKEILSVLENAKTDGNLKRELIKQSITDLREKTGLTDNDFNIFESVYEYLFNKTNGVYNIERANEFSGGRSNYGITESLFATINSTTEANYLEMRIVNDSYVIRYKEKWNSRDKMFQLRKAINDNVHRKTDEHFLDDFKISPKGSVLFGDFLIETTSSPSLGIFAPINSYADFSIIKDGNKVLLSDYFKDILEEIYSLEGRRNVLNNRNEKYTEFINLLSQIDKRLGTKFLSETGLQQLRIFMQLWKASYKGDSLLLLLITAARVAGAYEVNSEFKKYKQDHSEVTSFDILSYLKNNNPTPYSGMKLLKDSDRSVVNKYEGGIYIGGVPSNSDVLDTISDAEAIFLGDNTKSVTRNLENNNIPNVSVNFTDIILEFLDQGSDNSTPADMLLFSGDKAYSIVDTIIDTDVETRNGSKSVDLFTTSELLFHSLVNKFIYGILNTGMFISLPTVYSDKKKFLNFVVNWRKIKQYKDFFLPGETPNVFKIPEQLHIDTIQETLGEYYKTLFKKIALDYRIIFDITELDDLLVFLIANQKMKEHSIKYGKKAKNEFIKLANSKGVKVFEDLHYRNLSKTLISPNETLYHYATYLFTPEHLSDFLKELKIAYVNLLLDNYVVINADAMIRDTLENKTDGKTADWILDNLLVLAKVNGENIIVGDPIPSGANIELNPILNTYFYLHNVIDNNIKLGISGHELHHKIKGIGSVLKDTGIPASTYLDIEQSILDEYASIIDNDSKEEVNTVNKKIKNLRETLNKSYYTLISLALNAQFKRTVPIPGTIRPFSLGTLKGIASTYDCAVVEDLKALTHDFAGNHGFEDDSSDVDAHDGSAWIDPFTSILENYSLEDSEGGEVKKPLWDIDEPEYGVRRLVKYASNTITNRIMLQSSKSSLTMYKLFKKMTNCRKFDDIDLVDDWFITGGYKSDSFTTNIINRENPLFYSHNGLYYLILNFGKEIINGLKVYFTIEDEVSENGNTLGNPLYKVYHYFDTDSNHIKVKEGEVPPIGHHTINSLFELHAAMGGIESMSIKDGKLVESEASNRAVAHFMIYVSKPTEKYNELEGKTHYTKGADITLEYFELPLKTRLINCLINLSAIKNGASNINSVNSLFDNSDLLYDTYSTLKYGILQDSDHTADEGKVTEMSLVISALDANGLYHDEVSEIYKVLGLQALKAALIEEEAIHSNYDKLYEVIGKTLVNNILRDERGLTRAVLYQIRKNFGLSSNHKLDKIKIPFSDPSIYGKIMQVMGSILNKKSIKRKYPGMGLVMVPAFGIYLIWEIDGKKYQYKDLLKRAVLYNKELGEQGIADTGDPVEFNNKIVNLYLDVVSPNKSLYDTGYALNKESISLLYARNSEIAKIGTQEEYAEYLSSIYPQSLDKSIYWHGSDSDFSEGFKSAKKGKGSGAPETKKRNDFYLAKQAWSVLLYVPGVNRTSVDKNGFSHWNKLWWEFKEIMANGRRENNDWKDLVINEKNVRQAIPNKKGEFNRDTGGENGKWLKERKADYGYEDKSDLEFFEEILGVKWGEDTFNTWTERNKEIFKSLQESTKGIYPLIIDTTNPIRESGLDTYYEEHRGLMTKADEEGYDAILSALADNEFNSDIGVVLNVNDLRVHFLGTKEDLENFKKWKETTRDSIESKLSEVDPTNVIDITYVDSKGDLLQIPIKLNSLPDYYDFKENVINFLKSKGYNVTSIVSIEKNNKVPRDLAPTRVHFTYDYNGLLITTNLFDTWIYKEMYLAMKLKKQDPENADYYDRVINSYKKQIPGFLASLEKGIYVFKDKTFGTITLMSNLAAETIMSNVYKSRMGIVDGDEIPDIDSPEYFKVSINPLNSVVFDYDFQLITKNNNNNIYISLNSLSEDNKEYLVRYQPWKTTNITKIKVNKNTDSSKVVNRVYAIDKNNIKLFEIGRDLDVSDEVYYDKDTQSYKSIATDEVVTGRKLFRETDEDGNEKVLEYVEFLLKSEIKPKNKHSFIKYNIDLAKLNKVLLRTINLKTKEETQEKFDNALTNIIESLYKSDSFLMITPARQFKKENYNKIKVVLNNLSNRNKNTDLGLYLKSILDNVFVHSSGTIEGEGYINLDSGNTKRLNTEVESLGIDRGKLYGNNLIKLLRNNIKSNPLIAENFVRIRDLFSRSKISYYDEIYLNKMALKQFASFLKSLFFTSSRIPAQTLLSFMKMECVGFNGVDTNYCAVSHFLTFLLGSDYDIDKSYMMGLNFDNNGIYMGWSDLFSYNSIEEIEASEELPMPLNKQYTLILGLEQEFLQLNLKPKVIDRELISQNLLNLKNKVLESGEIDISLEAIEIYNEKDFTKRISLIAKLLKKLNKLSNSKEVKVHIYNFPGSALEFVNNVLNRHEQSGFGNNTDAVLKNYVSSNILKLIQRLGNLADAYTPVEMNALRRMLKHTPKQELATSLTLFNPAMIPIMLNTNMTGKLGTGVAANGLKGLFMWRFGTLDTLMNNPDNAEYVVFNTVINGVQGRFAYEQAKKKLKIEEAKDPEEREVVNVPTLTPTLIESLPDLGKYSGTLSVLHPNIKSDNIGSLYISAATDNAKELILAAINSGTKLMKCHLYLLSLGFNVDDIISFMTSPAVSFIDSISDDNIFNGTLIKINDAIDFAKKCIILQISYNITTDLDERNKIKEALDGYSLRGIRKAITDSFKMKLNRVENLLLFLADLDSLKNILKGANEFSSFGTILGINQGIPLTKEDLFTWKNKLFTTVSIAVSNLELISRDGNPLYCEAVKLFFLKTNPEIFKEGDTDNFNLGEAYELLKIEKGGKSEILKLLAIRFCEYYLEIIGKNNDGKYFIDFNVDKWLENLAYRDLTSEFYNRFKLSINIFYLIDHIPHYKSMFRIANILNKIDLRISLKSQISNHFDKLLKRKYPYAPNDYSNKLLPVIDEILIGHYIKSSGISIELKDSWKILDENYKEENINEDLPGKLLLLTDNDISSFKYIFENYIIPELLNGTLLDNSEDNDAIKNNEFIRNLMITSEKGKPLYKEDINLLMTDSNDEVRRKYLTLLEGLKELKPYEYKGTSLIDLFMLYNIIVNKNRYGAERMTEIFEDFILDYDADNFNSSFLINYLINLGEEDYNKLLYDKIISSVTLTDLLLQAAPLVSRIDNNRLDPFIKMLDPTRGYVFYEKTSKQYSTTPIDMLVPIPGELYNQAIERLVRFTEYGFGMVYSQYVSEIVNNLMSDNFEYVLSLLMLNLTVQLETDCKKENE